jgi:hypothetical protein
MTKRANQYIVVGLLWASLMVMAVLASCGHPYQKREMPQWQGTNVGKGSWVRPTRNPGQRQ